MNQYTDLKNGIIRDNKTHLEWQATPFDPAPWQDQMDAAERLDLGGHKDWRLPTVEELITLVDYSRVAPASGFPGMSSDWFWSSSCAAYTSYAWYVYFGGGYVSLSDKTSNGHARCVRGQLVGDSDLRAEVERLRKLLDEERRDRADKAETEAVDCGSKDSAPMGGDGERS